MPSKLTEEKFLDDVKNHKMSIVCDNGINRNIIFKRPDSSTYYFQLTTWNNHLCISGDMGTYVFERCQDMFAFFRMDKNDFNFKQDKKLQINAGYWHEKLQAEGKHFKSEEFSEELFIQQLKSLLEDFCDGNDIDEEGKQEIWGAIESDASNISTIEEAVDFINQPDWVESHEENQEAFAEYLQSEPDFGGFEDYTHHFIWCLYAIVWGIKQYDEYKESLEKEISTHIADTFALGIASINRSDS